MNLSPATLATLRMLENALLLAGISAAIVFVGAIQGTNGTNAFKAAGVAAFAVFAKGALQAVNDALNRAKTLVPSTATTVVTTNTPDAAK